MTSTHYHKMKSLSTLEFFSKSAHSINSFMKLITL